MNLLLEQDMDDSDEDELDAYMKSLEKDVAKKGTSSARTKDDFLEILFYDKNQVDGKFV